MKKAGEGVGKVVTLRVRSGEAGLGHAAMGALICSDRGCGPAGRIRCC